MRQIALSALNITGPSENSSSEPLISQKMKKEMNSGLKGAVFVLPYFIVNIFRILWKYRLPGSLDRTRPRSDL